MIKNRLHQCKECKLYYENKKLAKECYEYCKTNKSCNLEIIKHAVKQ